MKDRKVHADLKTPGQIIEVVRYDRAGKWYMEGASAFDRELSVKTKLSLHGAATLALYLEQCGGAIYQGRSGGTAFDRRVERVRSDRLRTTS